MIQHPIQQLYKYKHGTIRFRKNAIVRFLLDAGPYDLNDLDIMSFSDNDWEQFAQLIGYSLSLFGDSEFVSDATYDRAEIAAIGLDGYMCGDGI